MAAGLPPVVTNVGGNPDIVKNGENGLVVEPKDTPALADAILDRTVHNAYRLSLLGDSQRKIRGFRAISHT